MRGKWITGPEDKMMVCEEDEMKSVPRCLLNEERLYSSHWIKSAFHVFGRSNRQNRGISASEIQLSIEDHFSSLIIVMQLEQ